MESSNQLIHLPKRRPLSQAITLCLALGSSSSYAVNFNVINTLDSGAGSLREAVASANTTPGSDDITFDPALGQITLTSGQIEITEELTITGPANGQMISGNNASRIFAFTKLAENLTLENLTLTNGKTTADGVFLPYCSELQGRGGAVCSISNLTLINSTVTASVTEGGGAYGGGVFVDETATLTNSTISANSTTGIRAFGGGIAARYLALNDSNVLGNSTSGIDAYGGGIDSFSAVLTNSTVTNNSTAGDYAYGGGLNAYTATLNGSTVSSNRTTGYYSKGGGIQTYYSLTLINTTISDNSTTGDYADGGGVYDYGTNGLIVDPQIPPPGGPQIPSRRVARDAWQSSRKTDNEKRPIGATPPAAIITSSTISGNSTNGLDSDGGGLDANFVIITDSLISNNFTTKMGSEGGGVDAKYATVTNSSISGNSTSGDEAEGGGINVSFAASITTSTVSGNRTTGNQAEGGGIDAGSAIITSSTVSDNSTAGDASAGGGINIFRDATISNSTITGNHTTGSNSPSGGLYQVADANETLTLNSVILAGNTRFGNVVDNFAFDSANTPVLDVNFSLFGDLAIEISGANNTNVLTNTPGLAVLSDNGCATPAGAPVSAVCVQTHAIQLSSLALNAGDNSLTLASDQRGTGFPRVINSQADIGAFEASSVDGLCGNDNTQTLTSTPTNLCATGNPGTVSGTGPWSWSCDGLNGGNNDSCSANLQTYNIVATASPIAGGSASCVPNPIDHGADSSCSATPIAGYIFNNWSGDCSGNTCDLASVTSAKNVIANFALIVDGACGNDNGQTLTTTPVNLCTGGSASVVNGTGPWNWSCNGANSGTNASCSAALQAYTIIVNANPVEGGTINCTPNPVDHGANSSCTASPNVGFRFTDWSGDCSGSSCTISNVGSALNIIANFARIIDGACGLDDGQTLTDIPTNLCLTGDASLVSGNGPWSWSCTGSNGGVTSACSATIPSRPIPASGTWSIIGLSVLLGLLGLRKKHAIRIVK